MQLLILRHGEAEPTTVADEARQLTERGRGQVASICELRAGELEEVSAIWASPFVRARQTAEIVAEALGLPIITEPLLIGDTPPQQVIDTLDRAESFPLLLVSHQPLVGRLVNDLCGSGSAHSLDTSSLACLRAEVWANGCAELEWLQHAE